MSLKHSSASVCLVLFVLGCSTASSQDCDPDCAGKNCGPDGCGGSCGSCAGSTFCQNDGTCCIPDCSNTTCGYNGCRFRCSSCNATLGQVCNDDTGICCVPQCNGKRCGPDGCGGLCGPGCQAYFETCLSNGTCQCTNVCGTCGLNGCNENVCGACNGTLECCGLQVGNQECFDFSTVIRQYRTCLKTTDPATCLYGMSEDCEFAIMSANLNRTLPNPNLNAKQDKIVTKRELGDSISELLNYTRRAIDVVQLAQSRIDVVILAVPGFPAVEVAGNLRDLINTRQYPNGTQANPMNEFDNKTAIVTFLDSVIEKGGDIADTDRSSPQPGSNFQSFESIPSAFAFYGDSALTSPLSGRLPSIPESDMFATRGWPSPPPDYGLPVASTPPASNNKDKGSSLAMSGWTTAMAVVMLVHMI